MGKEQQGDGTLETWTPEEVHKALEANDITLIDVRTPQEYLLESIDGAFLLPMARFDTARVDRNAARPVVLFCGSSKRSGKLARELLDSGHRIARRMEWGIGGWKEAGLPYRTVDLPSGEPKLANAS